MIGAGLAGLTAAVRLAEGGADVTVVAKGAGSLHLSPGTIDVLGYAPGRVRSPRAELPGFVAGRPAHPYARVAGALEEALDWFRRRTPGLRHIGGTERNMLLPTALGVPRPTALAPASIAAGDLASARRLVIVGLRALKDFFPRMAADNLALADVPGGPPEVRHAEAAWSPRPGRADVAAPVFARALDAPGARAELTAELRTLIAPGETLALPAVVGLTRAAEAWDDLVARIGAPVAEIPTIPPSVAGMRLQLALAGALADAGGRLVLGPAAVGGEGSNGRLTGVLVRDAARERAVPADAVVLATGGFSAGGVELDSHGALTETVLGLPVAGPREGADPLSVRHLDHQPLMTAGVATDDALRPVDGSGAVVWENLRAAGTIVAGAEPWREKSGEGVAIAGGHMAATSILGAT